QSELINLSDGTKINSTRYNNGIKIDAREGAPVVASESGTVDKTDTFKYYGKTIIIKHGRGYMTVYSYLKEIKVKEGEMVKRGEQIGLVGKHERSNRFSLHFEVRHKNRAKNPLFYLPKSQKEAQ
ncbi:MAG: M23 family metallopeptidase, partial [Syntrophaceae bacterium]|nr:M23 family metallopeptidase [Syntrophaceae bacterium]